MPNKLLILEKIDEILRQLKHLKILHKLSGRILLSDDAQMFFAERVMERMIEAAVDINMHIISDIKEETPKSTFDSFIILGCLKIIPRKFAESIARSTGLRNILAHEYMKLDIKKFKKGMDDGLRDYPKYVKYIKKILK